MSKTLRLSGFIATALAALLAFSPARAEDQVLRMATTTSTDNSGLLKALLPPFEQRSGYRVDVIAVGTGKALKLLEDGNVDVVMVHAPEAEQKVVDAGFAVNRRPFMVNDFVIVGPAHNPAGIKGEQDATRVLKKIAETRSVFVSRGDESGTHKKEKELWQAAGMQPEGAWYRSAGRGMGEVLLMAGELDGYTLTDRGTWLAYRGKTPLAVLAQGDERLLNPYAMMAGNPDKYPDMNYFGAMQLIAWVTSVPGQQVIRDFKINGQALFIPTAVSAK